MRDRYGWTQRAGYGLGSMGISLLVMLISAFLTMYLTNVAFLDVAAVSVIMAVSRIFDGISDLVIGNIIDNTESKFGKARTWLLRVCLPLVISLFLLFYVPDRWPELIRYIYVFIMYNLVNTVIRSFIQISHYSLMSLITDDPMEQGLLGNIQSIMMNLGMIGGSVIIVRLLEVFTDEPGNQNTQRAYSGAVPVIGLIVVSLIVIMVACTRERVSSGSPVKRREQTGLKEKLAGLRQVLLDRDWLIMVLCSFLCSVIMQTRVTSATYYALYLMGDMGKVGWLNSCNMGASIAVQFFTPFLMKRYGLKNMFSTGIFLAAAGLIGFGLTAGLIPAMVAFMITVGIGDGIYHAMIPGIFAMLITDIAGRTGRLQAGIGNAGLSTASKLGQGLGGVAFGFALSAAGFNAMLDSQGVAQPQTVNTAITTMYIWMPLALYITVFILFTLFFDRNDRLRKGRDPGNDNIL